MDKIVGVSPYRPQATQIEAGVFHVYELAHEKLQLLHPCFAGPLGFNFFQHGPSTRPSVGPLGPSGFISPNIAHRHALP